MGTPAMATSIVSSRPTSIAARWPPRDRPWTAMADASCCRIQASSLAWIRQQDASAIAVHGLSLGGHLAAMLVGLEDTIDVAIAGVPMSSVLSVLRNHVIRPLTGDRDTASYLGSEPARAL